MTESLPQEVQNLINEYFNLPLGGKKIRTPYYINIKNLRMGLRVLVGKGSPEEIVQESKIYEKLRGVNFDTMTEDEIREFMKKRHIGIDCSGFIVHLLDKWLTSQGKKHLWHYLKFPEESFYRKIARMLRPVENISAADLTNDVNSQQISNLSDVKVGDLIRAKSIKKDINHVMMISEIERKDGKTISFKFVHATKWYNKQHGVRNGTVFIKDSSKHLKEQEWKDDPGVEKNYAYEEVCGDPDYAQVRRLINVPL